MSKVLKYAFVFGSGVAVGFVYGGLFTVLKGLENDRIRSVVVNAMSDKFNRVIYGNEKVSV